MNMCADFIKSFVEIPHDSTRNLELSFNAHWTTILKSTDHLLGVSQYSSYLPGTNSSSNEK